MSDAFSRDQLLQLAKYGARARLAELRREIAAIEALVGGTAATRRGPRLAEKPRSRAKGKRRSLSAAGRAAISAAQKARWAKLKGKTTGRAHAGHKTSRKRGRMSSAARKAASERMKKYWAARRAAKK